MAKHILICHAHKVAKEHVEKVIDALERIDTIEDFKQFQKRMISDLHEVIDCIEQATNMGQRMEDKLRSRLHEVSDLKTQIEEHEFRNKRQAMLMLMRDIGGEKDV